MTTCVYVRVSTTDQKTDSQQAEIVDWLQRHGLTERDVQWYIDRETGKTLARPAMTRLRRDVAAGAVQTIIVQRLDRLSRRLIDGLTLLAEWAERGIRIVAVRQHVDLSGAAGRLVAAVLLGVAEMELELRRERQKAGIAVARKAGKYRGRKRGTFKADPQRARELVAAGWSIAEVARALGVSRDSVVRYLRPETQAKSDRRSPSGS